MNRAERRQFLDPSHRGLVLSPEHRLSRQTSFTNLVLVAPTGSGKTTRYVIPNVLAVEGSVVVTDPAGEIHAATSDHLRNRGFRLFSVRPAELAQSERFNPLAQWRTPQELRQLASMLGRTIQGPGSDPFWSTAAINLLSVGLSAVAVVENEQERTLGNLRWLLNQFGTGKTVHRFMSSQLRDQRLFAEYKAFCAQDEKVKASILSTARAALELWSDADVCRLTASNTVDIAALRREPTAIYLIVPEHQVRYFAPVLNLFYAACFAHCLQTGQEPGEHPVYFFLDEFANLGYIPDFPSIITTLRKRRCSVSIILQELSQLRAVYGVDEARTIFSGGCANKLFFSGLDLETALYVEQALGSNTEYDTTFGGINDRARTLGVPLLRADEIRMLPRDQAILISGRERPVRFETRPVFLT